MLSSLSWQTLIYLSISKVNLDSERHDLYICSPSLSASEIVCNHLFKLTLSSSIIFWKVCILTFLNLSSTFLVVAFSNDSKLILILLINCKRLPDWLEFGSSCTSSSTFYKIFIDISINFLFSLSDFTKS